MPTRNTSQTERIRELRARTLSIFNKNNRQRGLLDAETVLERNVGALSGCCPEPPSTVNLASCIGIYPTGQFFGDVTCDGTTCTWSGGSGGGRQVQPVPGTTYTRDPLGETIVLVNCSNVTLYWKHNLENLPGVLLPGRAGITNAGSSGSPNYGGYYIFSLTPL